MGDRLCIVEAMKLYDEIKASTDCRIVILATSAPVPFTYKFQGLDFKLTGGEESPVVVEVLA